MSTPLTDQQRRAVEHRGSSVVLASGAGCGKTHVLTARYVSHLTRDDAEVGQVVAITFTDRAAREMRDRIRGEVAKLPDPRRHLRNLETAPINTIHGFCGNLLRQFAVPAHLDPGFEVLDDVLSANIRTEALAACLHGLLAADHPPVHAGGSPREALRELVVLYGYAAVAEAIDGLLLDVDRPAWDVFLARKPQDIAAEWTGPVRAAMLPPWVEYLCAASPKVARLMALLGRVECVGPETKKSVARLLAEVPRLHGSPDLAAAAEELAELAKVGKERARAWRDEETYERVREAFADFRADLPKRFDLFAATPEGVDEAARVGQLFLRVAAAADDAYRARKRRAGVLDFQDLLVKTRDLLRDHAEVRDQLRARFRFVLLDELQDTDPVQMELVELLCGPGVRHGALFAVGDHKQSIYRFRGAEVGLFQTLRRSVDAAGRLGLTRNYRSQPGVLHFVNALFSRRIPDYEPLEAHHPAAGDENVEFLWAVANGRCRPAGGEPADEDHAPDVPSHQPADTGRSPSALRAAEAECLAARVAELLADPTPRVLTPAGPRRVEPRDVTLLFRSMSHVAIYEAALRRHGLDYYLVGGRAFFAQQEVYDLLNLLRAVENPQDGASLVGVLRSPFCGLSDEAIVLLATHPDGAWAGLFDAERFDALPADQKPAAERARRHLTRWRRLKDRLPIARLLGEVFADSGYDAATQFEFLGDRKLANLWKLVDLARSFDRGGLFGLHEFTARLGDLVARQPREEQAATLPESADVVKLMSIHQAKGLEFPVVIVPDVAATGRGGHSTVARWHRGLGCLAKVPGEFDSFPDEPPFPGFADRLGRTADQLADWQEDLRVLYVACTRARDLLILSAGLPEPPAAGGELPANHWTLALAERFDVRTGRCLGDGPGVRARVIEPGQVKTSRTIDAESPHDSDEKNDFSSDRALFGVHRAARLLESSAVWPHEIPLPALERLARGEHVADFGEHFDTEDDGDRGEWRHPRERLGPVPPAELALWAVLDRWDFADVDGWAQLLADATADAKAADALRPKLRGFADSPARAALAAALRLRRGVEFLADLAAVAPSDAPASLPVVRGVIDFLYRDAGGWRVLGIDLGTADEDDPWRGRRPGLVLQAWAAARQLGEWPAAVALYDLATGQLVEADPRRAKPAAVADHFRRILARRFPA
jgi:ATP-dependent helicase/nuclease subunit A